LLDDGQPQTSSATASNDLTTCKGRQTPFRVAHAPTYSYQGSQALSQALLLKCPSFDSLHLASAFVSTPSVALGGSDHFAKDYRADTQHSSRQLGRSYWVLVSQGSSAAPFTNSGLLRKRRGSSGQFPRPRRTLG
jgi:hypothetical protein